MHVYFVSAFQRNMGVGGCACTSVCLSVRPSVRPSVCVCVCVCVVGAGRGCLSADHFKTMRTVTNKNAYFSLKSDFKDFTEMGENFSNVTFFLGRLLGWKL